MDAGRRSSAITHVADLALARRLPGFFDVRDYIEAGGLASYGSGYHNRVFFNFDCVALDVCSVIGVGGLPIRP